MSDDTPIPEDDAIATGARRALRRLADGAAVPESWSDVRAGARRVRQRRIATVSAVCAIALAAGGAAAAVVGNSRTGRTEHRAGKGATSSTSTFSSSTSTSTSAPTSTSTPPVQCGAGACGAGAGSSTTTAPIGAVPTVQAADLSGTITLGSTTLVAGQATLVALTVRNVSDHPVELPNFEDGVSGLGVSIDYINVAYFNVADPGSHVIFAPGEQQTYTTSIAPRPEAVGSTSISAAVLRGAPMMFGASPDPLLTGIPPVAITIDPPGWSPGQPLDPSQGQWKAEMSADTTQVAIGDSVVVHATLTNGGDQPEATRGFASLAIACGESPGTLAVEGQFVDAVTIAPGASQSFSFQFRPGEYAKPSVECFVGVAFHKFPEDTTPRAGMQTDTVTITVLPAPTTTTGPDTPTSNPTP